jgi:hypothetical protein
MSPKPRSSIASALCGTLGVLLLVSGMLLAYATRSLFDSRGFADRAAASLEDTRVAEFVAERIADAAIQASPDLVALKPILVGVGRTMVSSAPFRAAVRRSARTAHRAVMSGGTEKLALTVQDLGDVLKSALATQPGLAEKIPSGLKAKLGSLEGLPAGEVGLRLVRAAHRMRAATLLAFLLGIGFCAASVALSREGRRTMVRIGAGLAVAALLFAVVARFGGDILGLFARRADLGPVIAGLTSSYLKGLFGWAAVLGFAGLVLAAASASLLERVPISAWLEGTRQWLFGPQPLMRWRLTRGLLGAVLGVVAVVKPLPMATLAAWLGGVLLVFAGLREAFIAALHLLPQIEGRATEAMGGRAAPRARSVAMVTGLALVLVAGAVVLFMRGDGAAQPATGITSCNGSPLLCDRRLDEVTFATAHNAMGGGDDPRWMTPNQSAGIQQQLSDEVRAFLIDVHYGIPVGDRVKTELQDEQAAMAKYEAAVGKEGMEAALRVRDRLVGAKESDRDVFMCHGFCELGALRLVPVLRAVREFLVANPGEVLIFVIQDEGVRPQDIERCFEESGLIDFVYRGPAGPPWPTLREMAESDQRVLVMAENDAAGVPWYHPAFELVQETPYTFHDPSEFSNRPNRGGTSASLLLLNHWIESTPTPKPSNAAIVNAYDVLLKRARDCERERGRKVNLVAVDFYKVGDLIDVVRTLNGLPRRASSAVASP